MERAREGTLEGRQTVKKRNDKTVVKFIRDRGVKYDFQVSGRVI